jgi:hypothetical protein
MRRARLALTACAALILVLNVAAAPPATDQPDLAALQQIETEGLQHSAVMETTSYLTDVYGPRLTGSPAIRQAADWAEQRLKQWDLANVHRETWRFGRGWENRRFVALAVSPRAYPLIAYPKAWTPGTNGPVTAEAVLAVISSDKDFDQFRGRLRGKFVLTAAPPQPNSRYDALGRRYGDEDLTRLTEPPQPRQGPRGTPPDVQFLRRRAQFWIDEGVAATLDYSRGEGGTVFVQSGGPWATNAPATIPQVTLALEHYGRIARTLEKKVPVTLQFDIENQFYDDDPTSFNIIAEIPGTDKADESVMIGAHFDSWHTGTGATDNAAGSAVVMEAMRILKASGLTPRRTIRLALWTGEEEGLFGSRDYVKTHFADPTTMELKPDHAKLSAYFNVDNGTGQIRGIWGQGNDALAPLFTSWMAPFKQFGMTTFTTRGTGGTDHASFDAVGLPAFQFIQDPLDYDSRTHHSNMDMYERVQPQDMMRNSVIVAGFAYDVANRDDMLPRKALPKPRQAN